MARLYDVHRDEFITDRREIIDLIVRDALASLTYTARNGPWERGVKAPVECVILGRQALLAAIPYNRRALAVAYQVRMAWRAYAQDAAPASSLMVN